MEKHIGISAEKPISVWNKLLKADFKSLFKALTNAVGHGVTGNWVQLGKDALDTISAIGFEKDPGQLAWLLIYKSLMSAMFDLVSENKDILLLDVEKVPDDLCEKIDFALEENVLKIDQTFFERPQDLSLLTDIIIPFKQWLVGYGFKEAQAENLCARLKTYFVFALNKEWRKNAEKYKPIIDSLDTPFTKAGKLEQAWGEYYAWLRKQVDESMFSETFSLSQVYVPLRAYKMLKNEEKTKDEEFERNIQHDRDYIRQVVDLEKELDSWLYKHDPKDALRVISGGPGCGKSSFAKIYAAQKSTDSTFKVLFIPLHQFDPGSDLEQAVGEFIRSTNLLPQNPLDSEKGEGRLFIIFDGLDELAIQGKISAEAALNFIREIEKTVSQRNMMELRLQVLLSGRTLIIQANQSEFRKSGQILNILPYYLTDREKEGYNDTNKHLDEDQRNIWWEKHGLATGIENASLPKELKRNDLDEITAQPLLNYLVAISFNRGKLDFSKEINRNIIYDDLLRAVHERAYEGRPYASIKGVSENDFIRVLEEIGLATWHGDGRKTTVKEIHKHCEIGGLTKLLNDFSEGAEAGVTKLLTAFYFRQYGSREGDKTFEFTHKSFGEFLTAKRIVRALKRMQIELERRENDPDDGWNYRNALEYWISICGPTVMDSDLFRFLKDEVHQQDKSTAEKWQKMLSDCIGYMLKHGMPFEELGERPSFIEESRQSRNAEETLLASMNACASLTKRLSTIDWPEKTSAGAWISKLRGQRSGSGNVLAMRTLGFIDISSCEIYINDLYAAKLNNSNLRRINATFCNFFEANLEGANLEGAYLEGAHFQRANLEGAYLEGAHLGDANLEGANLQGAHLQRANLQGANLQGANLQGAYLEGAYLEGAYLQGANLEGANLQGANLQGVNLKGAKLKGVNLKGAKLKGAKLKGTILEKNTSNKVNNK